MADLIVSGIGRRAQRGFARLGPLVMQCALGRGGRRVMKREGDGATPIGRWPIREVYVRPTGQLYLRLVPAAGRVRLLRPDDGWCDAPGARHYNQRVRHPYPDSAERLWRDDHLYDAIVVLGYNHCPRRRNRGSAIFLHLLRRAAEGDNILPTEGCIGLEARDLRVVLGRLGRGSAVRVLG
jgi:L,D-peptidoglycan transpeptidase YkuD (ErfK/YbiS/YcfS/YnhG family)